MAIRRSIVAFGDPEQGNGSWLVFTEQGGELSVEQVPGVQAPQPEAVTLQETETTDAGGRDVRGTVTDADGTECCRRLRDSGDGLAPVCSGGCPGLLRRPEAPVERGVTAADRPWRRGRSAGSGTWRSAASRGRTCPRRRLRRRCAATTRSPWASGWPARTSGWPTGTRGGT